MMNCCYVPDGVRYYIVPIPKPKECFSKPLSSDHFRGIAICQILSKVFEYCLLDRYSSFLNTPDNKFGFKKGVGFNIAIRTVRYITDSLIKDENTVNICSIDLSKAFDKVNHSALY